MADQADNQDFPERLRGFLSENLGMSPLHMAVGQGCIHLVLMLLDVGRGAGLVGPTAQRLRRHCIGSASGGAAATSSLPSRLLTFMREVLPDGGAAAPGYVTVRHNRRTYELDCSNAVQEQPEQEEQQSAEASSPRQRQQQHQRGSEGQQGLRQSGAHGERLRPHVRSDTAATAAAAGEGTDVDAAAASATVGTQTGLGEGAAEAADRAMAATTSRTSAVASTSTLTAVSAGGEGSGGTWGSSGAGNAMTRSWVAWPVSQGAGAGARHASTAGGSNSVIGGGVAGAGAGAEIPGLVSERVAAGGGGEASMAALAVETRATHDPLGHAAYDDGASTNLGLPLEPVRSNENRSFGGGFDALTASRPPEAAAMADAALQAGGSGGECFPDTALLRPATAPSDALQLGRVPYSAVGLHRRSDSNVQNPVDKAAVAGTAAAAADNSSSIRGGSNTSSSVGVRSEVSAWQPQPGIEAAAAASAPTNASSTATASVQATLTFPRSAWGPTLIDDMRPPAGGAAEAAAAAAGGWLGPSYPPSLRTHSPPQLVPHVAISPTAQQQQQQPGQQPNSSGVSNVIAVRVLGGGNGGGGYGEQSSGTSLRSMLGAGSVEIPDALVRLLIPQVPLAVARLQNQSHTQPVELLSPAVAIWPTPTPASAAAAAAAAPSASTASAGPPSLVVEPEIGGQEVAEEDRAGEAMSQVGTSRPAMLQPLRPSAIAAAATGAKTGTGTRAATQMELSSNSPAGGLCIVMRCPDAIASRSRGRGHGGGTGTGGIGDSAGERAVGSAREGAAAGGRSTSGVDAAATAAATVIDDPCGGGNSWGEREGDRGESGSETNSTSNLGQVSQLVAWNRNGVIPLLQLDDFTEGCTRATLLLTPPLAPPLTPAAHPELQPPPQSPSSSSPGEQQLQARTSDNRARASRAGSSGSATGGGGGSSGAGAAAVSAAPAAQLVYVAWRRGQSLGPPCPLLLLPCGLEDVASELQALQPPPGQTFLMSSSYQAFLADLGIWLEALHASAPLSYTATTTTISSQPSSSATGGMGNGNGSIPAAAAASGSLGLLYRPRQLFHPSRRSSSGRTSSPGTGMAIGIGSGFSPPTAAAAAAAAGTASPAHGDLMEHRYSFGNSGGGGGASNSPWRASGPISRVGSAATAAVARQLTPLPTLPTTNTGGAPVAPAAASAGPSRSPGGLAAAEPLAPGDLLQRIEDMKPFCARGPQSFGTTRLPAVSPPLLPGARGPATAATPPPPQPQQQQQQTRFAQQRVTSGSPVMSGSDVLLDERIARIAEEVFCLGCDLLAYAVARGAEATARLIMGLLLVSWPQALPVTSLGVGAASSATATATAAAVQSGTITSWPRSVGSGGGPGLGRLQSVVSGFGAAEASVAAPQPQPQPRNTGQSVRAARLRCILDTCRNSNEQGHTLLHLAILSRSLPVVRLLLVTWPQEYGMPISELNLLDKAGLPPIAYLPSLSPPSPPASAAEQPAAAPAAAAMAEFAAAVEPLLLALGPPMPSEEGQAAAAASAAAPGRWGLQAVQEGGSETTSPAASGMWLLPGASARRSLADIIGIISSGGAGGGGAAHISTSELGTTGEEAQRLGAASRRLPRRRSGGAIAATAERVQSGVLQMGGDLREPPLSSSSSSAHISAAAATATAAIQHARASTVPSGTGTPAVAAAAAAAAVASPVWPQATPLGILGRPGGSVNLGRPLLRWALWAAVQVLLGSLQALGVLLFAMPRARDLLPSASFLAIPGALLWLPSVCLILTSCLSAAVALLPPLLLPLPPRWRPPLLPWLPAVFTSAGRTIACVMSLAAAVELSRARRTAATAAADDDDGSGGGGFRTAAGANGNANVVVGSGSRHGGLLTLMAGGRGMSGAEASMRMLLMTLAPTALEAGYVEPPIRASLLMSEYGLPLLYVILYDSVPAAVVWLAYAASNVILGMAVVALMDLHARGTGGGGRGSGHPAAADLGAAAAAAAAGCSRWKTAMHFEAQSADEQQDSSSFNSSKQQYSSGNISNGVDPLVFADGGAGTP
ncbi:hypothetical protein VOLCADRAFT_95256 [Volvox carteri f. nagariensis]|uniref:Uncharacterized protein n=1 Tax=Volvox carteri f. nagariensis TaxID=3068 RepID=D8U709_VOLCA|nr:uncharacterized protein VOLCADRAFT_95256 [Volvox carteri f. nagariensis]EFJ44533.1 hypothetical protein VOLCADRAFT_95256 [Volvox carteri f. nagariensis]|eukprot:XP_002954383.1 hypothetical protein VOLCADRAFT_95256 [Volvox carteri f. nagariensis]